MMGKVLTSRYTTLVGRFFTTGHGWSLVLCPWSLLFSFFGVRVLSLIFKRRFLITKTCFAFFDLYLLEQLSVVVMKVPSQLMVAVSFLMKAKIKKDATSTRSRCIPSSDASGTRTGRRGNGCSSRWGSWGVGRKLVSFCIFIFYRLRCGGHTGSLFVCFSLWWTGTMCAEQ